MVEKNGAGQFILASSQYPSVSAETNAKINL